ncbi:hypothetical protein T08_14676 [Trichinella sp. T8]|nr:hypothetical protein T08_14676 [Trichinella sp. T8]
MNRFSPQSKAGSGGHSQAVFAFDSGSFQPLAFRISSSRIPCNSIGKALRSCLFKNSVLLTIE